MCPAMGRDDPVAKYLPNFTYRLDGLDPESPPDVNEKPPITLFQLASHMSGLGRDWPAGTVSNWPHDMFGGGPPPTNGHPFPTNEDLIEAIAHHHLTSPPWFYPAYSNAGSGSLGLALAAASSAASGDAAVASYAESRSRNAIYFSLRPRPTSISWSYHPSLQRSRCVPYPSRVVGQMY